MIGRGKTRRCARHEPNLRLFGARRFLRSCQRSGLHGHHSDTTSPLHRGLVVLGVPHRLGFWPRGIGQKLGRGAPVCLGQDCDMKTLSNHPYVGSRGSLSWGHNWGDIARVEPSSLSRFPRNDLTSVGITSAVRSLGDPRMAGIVPQESSRLGRTATSLMCTSAEASTTKRTARATDAGRM